MRDTLRKQKNSANEIDKLQKKFEYISEQNKFPATQCLEFCFSCQRFGFFWIILQF